MTALNLCYPSWTAKYRDIVARGQTVIRSGCPTVNGNVQCKPEDMRADAERQLRIAGWWPADKKLSLEAYTLARYMQGEVGSKRLFETVAVGEAAVNRAKLSKKASVLDILLYRQKPGHPNYGWYGPIHGDGVTSAPYGRWATTSADPTIAAVMIADLILSGGSGNFNRLADDQNGMQYAKAFPNPEATFLALAKRGDYWVGPLPGVDHWRTTQFRRYGHSIASADGIALLKRSYAYFGADARVRDGDLWKPKQPVVWGDLPTCPVGDSPPDEFGPAQPLEKLATMLVVGGVFLAAGVWVSRQVFPRLV